MGSAAGYGDPQKRVTDRVHKPLIWARKKQSRGGLLAATDPSLRELGI